MTYDNANDIVDELLKTLYSRYEDSLETRMEVCDLVFDSVQFLYYKCQRINCRLGGSYIDSPDWIKKEKVTINPKNKDDICFQYPVTVALNYEETKWNPEKASNIKTFINKYKWKGINYPSKKDD